MSQAKFMVIVVAIWVLASNSESTGIGETPGNGAASICQYPCHPLAPPPPSPSGIPSYGAPPPPPPPPPSQVNCPPTVVQCCPTTAAAQSPPPAPGTYTYLPYDNYSASPPLPFSNRPQTCTFSSIFFLLFSSAVLF